MIRLGGLVSQKAFGKFEMNKVVSNPFATAFASTNEGEEGSDYEVSMAAKQLDDIIKSATELKAKMGEQEFNVAAWIQDHISKSQDYINQANYGFDKNESVVNEDSKFDLQLVKNMQQTIKDLETKLKVAKDSREKEMIKKNIAVNVDLMKYWAQRSRMGESVVKEESPCWKGYKQVGMKDKGGRQVPNCVPNESVVREEEVSTGERIQNLNNRIKALKDKMSATKSSEQKNLIQQRLKNALQTLSNYKKQNISKEGVVKEAKGRGFATIQNEMAKVVDAIQSELEKYKSNKGTDKAKQNVENLKKLNVQKQRLEDELDGKVTSLYADYDLDQLHFMGRKK